MTDYGEFLDNIDGPDIINNQAEIDQWDNLTVSLAPTDVFRIIFVDQVNFDGVNSNTGFIGVTKPTAKMTIVESTVINIEKLVMHEWGHTNDSRVNPVGTYNWPSHPSTNPAFSYTHYLIWADFSWHNIMTPTLPDAGEDGDINFKFTDYPWIEPNWWDSKRWNENF